MKRCGLLWLIGVAAAAVLIGGCGDGEVCGGYRDGTVGLVKTCDGEFDDGAASFDDRGSDPD